MKGGRLKSFPYFISFFHFFPHISIGIIKKQNQIVKKWSSRYDKFHLSTRRPIRNDFEQFREKQEMYRENN